MASKNLMYKVNGVPTEELIERYDNDNEIFFRFQEPHQRLTCRSKSWGMIFQTQAEALRDCEELGMSKEDAILPGKSCANTLEEAMNFIEAFDKDYIILVFEGKDTGCTGHDGECVATYYKKVAVWSYEDCLEYAKNNFKEFM